MSATMFSEVAGGVTTEASINKQKRQSLEFSVYFGLVNFLFVYTPYMADSVLTRYV